MHLSLDQQLDGTARTASGQDNDRLRRTGRWSIVPNGLADLNSVVLKSEAEIGDIKRTRMLLARAPSPIQNMPQVDRRHSRGTRRSSDGRSQVHHEGL
jgi:hypothetical protein